MKQSQLQFYPNDINNKRFNCNHVSNDGNFKFQIVILGNFENIMIENGKYCEVY